MQRNNGQTSSERATDPTRLDPVPHHYLFKAVWTGVKVGTINHAAIQQATSSMGSCSGCMEIFNYFSDFLQHTSYPGTTPTPKRSQ